MRNIYTKFAPAVRSGGHRIISEVKTVHIILPLVKSRKGAKGCMVEWNPGYHARNRPSNQILVKTREGVLA